MTTLELLKAGRAYLAQGPEFWRQDGLSGTHGQGQCCALGAIPYYYRHGAKTEKAYRRLRANLQGFRLVTLFNDDPTTTHADVLALYDRAIAAEEAKAKR